MSGPEELVGEGLEDGGDAVAQLFLGFGGHAVVGVYGADEELQAVGEGQGVVGGEVGELGAQGGDLFGQVVGFEASRDLEGDEGLWREGTGVEAVFEGVGVGWLAAPFSRTVRAPLMRMMLAVGQSARAMAVSSALLLRAHTGPA